MTASLSLRLNNVLVEHCTRYPHMQVQDVYKLLYQAAMGSGHAVQDVVRARSLLENEINLLIPNTDQPLVEQISPETNMERSIVRINLKPYLAATYNIDPLLEAFVCTANEFRGSIARLERYVSLFSILHSEVELKFSITDFEDYMKEMQIQNYPVIHHSKIYSRYYQPAYRVVALEFIESFLMLLKSQSIE